MVSADGHVHLFRRHQRCTTAGGASGGASRIVGVAHRAGVGCVTAPRHAEALTDRLAQDGAPGVQDAGHYGGIGIGNVALQDAGAVHHGDSGDADVVFDGDSPPRKQAAFRSLYFASPVPGPQGIVLRSGTIAGVSRVLHLQRRLGELIKASVRFQHWGHQAAKGLQVLVGGAEAVSPGYSRQIVYAGLLYGHGLVLLGPRPLFYYVMSLPAGPHIIRVLVIGWFDPPAILHPSFRRRWPEVI